MISEQLQGKDGMEEQLEIKTKKHERFNIMKKINSARALIRATGVSLNEAMALKTDDVSFDQYGHMTVNIAEGDCPRDVIVDDEEPVREILDEAKAAGREMLLETATPNFDCTHERATYARRLYARVSADGRSIGREFHTFGEGKYDAAAVEIVSRSMGIKNRRAIAKFFKEEL